MVTRAKLRSTPSGVVQVRAAKARTITPRSAGLSRGLTASEITLKRNRATCSARSRLWLSIR
jgi:hypothetical protein